MLSTRKNNEPEEFQMHGKLQQGEWRTLGIDGFGNFPVAQWSSENKPGKTWKQGLNYEVNESRRIPMEAMHAPVAVTTIVTLMPELWHQCRSFSLAPTYHPGMIHFMK